jgi:hypothetical protein
VKYNNWLKANPTAEHHVSEGEGLMYGALFLLMVGIIAVLLLIARAFARKQYLFYLSLALIIIIQTVMALSFLWQY